MLEYYTSGLSKLFLSSTITHLSSVGAIKRYYIGSSNKDKSIKYPVNGSCSTKKVAHKLLQQFSHSRISLSTLFQPIELGTKLHFLKGSFSYDSCHTLL